MVRRKQLPQEPVELTITQLSHDGRGIARFEDKITFVFNALPGETVKAKWLLSKNRYNEAFATEIINASPQRQQPICQHFGQCGGCQLQHMQPLAQIEFKQQNLAEQLKHQQIFPTRWLPPLTATTHGYRQKARLGVRYVFKKEALLVGFREQNNNKIAILNRCEILDQRVGGKIERLKELIASLEIMKEIPQIEIATTKEQVALIFRHMVELPEDDKRQLVLFCQQHNYMLYLQPKGIESIHKVWPADDNFYLTYVLADQNLYYDFHPCDFTQVNAQINQQMINAALEQLKPNQNDTILDLFSGLGNFSLPFAQKANKVVGVEGSTTMTQRASHNAEKNNINNAQFYTANLDEDFSSMTWAKNCFNKIILDPPRSGAKKVIENIKLFDAEAILYISCNPATFVRDAVDLLKQGYQLDTIRVMDMFAHTSHVETMGLFKKK